MIAGSAIEEGFIYHVNSQRGYMGGSQDKIDSFVTSVVRLEMVMGRIAKTPHIHQSQGVTQFLRC